MFLLFESTTVAMGDFVFVIWYKKVMGSGEEQPRKPNYLPGWVDPNNPENFIPEEIIEEEAEKCEDGDSSCSKDGES